MATTKVKKTQKKKASKMAGGAGKKRVKKS